MRIFLTAAALAALTMPVTAQWLNQPTAGTPLTVDGKPNLTAPTPRTADGRPDFTGLWTSPLQIGQPDVDPRDMQPWAKDVTRRRGEDFFKTRPMFQCLPSGPQTFGQAVTATVWKRIVQTPSLIAILNDDLTYRQIFMDGRALETAPNPTWMGYSVGRWEGDTLVVDSFGFNDRTWLNDRGLPHTEALRMTERYQRRDLGQHANRCHVHRCFRLHETFEPRGQHGASSGYRDDRDSLRNEQRSLGHTVGSDFGRECSARYSGQICRCYSECGRDAHARSSVPVGRRIRR